MVMEGSSQSSEPNDFATLKRQFDYEATAPLEVREQSLEDHDGVTVSDISYASRAGGRVTALIVSAGAGPHAGVLFGHWGPGNRTEFLSEAKIYARAAAVCLLIDYPWVRPAPWRRPLHYVDEPESDHKQFVETVIDLRRGLDLLSGLKDVDPNRLAYVGHSYGAQWGAILSAVEPRLKGVVLMGGVPDAEAIYRDAPDPGLEDLRRSTPKAKMDAFFKAYGRTAAVKYVPHSKAPLLFQFARREQLFDKKAMDRYAAAAAAPKTVLWYDTGHDLWDVRAIADRGRWLSERVGLMPINPILRASLGND